MKIGQFMQIITSVSQLNDSTEAIKECVSQLNISTIPPSIILCYFTENYNSKKILDYLKEQQLKIDFSSSIETLTLLLYGVEDFTTVLKEEKINLISPHNLVFFQNSFIKKINYIHKYV